MCTWQRLISSQLTYRSSRHWTSLPSRCIKWSSSARMFVLIMCNDTFEKTITPWIVCCDRLTGGSLTPLRHISYWFLAIGNVAVHSIFVRSILLLASTTSSLYFFFCNDFLVKYFGKFGERVKMVSGMSSRFEKPSRRDDQITARANCSATGYSIPPPTPSLPLFLSIS